MLSKYYYSKSLDLYISLEPLKVNERILNICKRLNINLTWNDAGIINYINFCEAKEILRELDSSMLSPKEFFTVINEAKAEGRNDVVKSLTSNEYVEWLDAAFINENDVIKCIEHPKVYNLEGQYEFVGDIVDSGMIEGRPGWIDYLEFKNKLGLPLNVYKNFGHVPCEENIWKYWSTNQKNTYVCPIRGYVLSSGTPSLDIDIPYIAKQPVLTLRECKKYVKSSKLNKKLISFYDEINEDYQHTIIKNMGEDNDDKVQKFYSKWKSNLEILDKSLLGNINELSVIQKERLCDILGLLKIVAINKSDLNTLNEFNDISNYINSKTLSISMSDIKNYLKDTSSKLLEVFNSGREVVFVMGHKNPDTDTIISSIFEAYRNTLLNEDKVYIPIIQSSLIPDEVRELLGNDICKDLILYTNPIYEKIKNSGYSRWILVDHNICEFQRYVVSIVDHHMLNESIDLSESNIPITWEMMGSTTALITLKLLSQGININEDVARVLYASTLMDTENRNENKISSKDNLVMNYLKRISGIVNDDILFQGLMDKLLQTNDIELLFNRDYKEDWGIFGYSVVKVKKLFTDNGEVRRPELFDKLKELANKNNKINNFSVTLVKVVDYMENNEVVNRERLIFVFNDYATKHYRQTLLEFAEKLIYDQFNGESNVYRGEDYIEYWGTGRQISRKFTAPYLEPVIREFNEYFYSPSTKLYVKREFMQLSEKLNVLAKENGIKLKCDEKRRVNHISFKEALELIKAQNQKVLTLKEYWQVLKDAEELNDTQMLKHLRSKDFVEMLDTIIIDSKYIINNCSFDKTTGELHGDKMKVEVLDAVPALISLENIDVESGLPCQLGDANQYNNKQLWRYWSPDSDVCIATRGHIFLLDQSALDTKIHLDDRLPNLGIRQCAYFIEEPVIEYSSDFTKNKGF